MCCLNLLQIQNSHNAVGIEEDSHGSIISNYVLHNTFIKIKICEVSVLHNLCKPYTHPHMGMPTQVDD